MKSRSIAQSAIESPLTDALVATSRTTWEKLGGWAFLGVVAAVLFARAMTTGLNHDEQQFVAPAALWAQYGMLPYRDRCRGTPPGKAAAELCAAARIHRS